MRWLLYILIGCAAVSAIIGIRLGWYMARRVSRDDWENYRVDILATYIAYVVAWPLLLWHPRALIWMTNEFRVQYGGAANPRSLLDRILESRPYQEQKQLFDLISVMEADGCDADELPDGRGEFGHDLSNPIPTKTVFGSVRYLSCLRMPDGGVVMHERQGSLRSPASPHPVDEYAIARPDGQFLATLYISPYHKRNSKKAPRGFALAES